MSHSPNPRTRLRAVLLVAATAVATSGVWAAVADRPAPSPVAAPVGGPVEAIPPEVGSVPEGYKLQSPDHSLDRVVPRGAECVVEGSLTAHIKSVTSYSPRHLTCYYGPRLIAQYREDAHGRWIPVTSSNSRADIPDQE